MSNNTQYPSKYSNKYWDGFYSGLIAIAIVGLVAIVCYALVFQS